MGTLAVIFITMSKLVGLPDGVLKAVCFVESSHKADAVNIHDGGSSSFGVCQIKLSTARMMGFEGTQKDLLTPEINAFYAGKYLKKQLVRYEGDVLCAIAAYNAGTCYKKNGHITNKEYVRKVMDAWLDNR